MTGVRCEGKVSDCDSQYGVAGGVRRAQFIGLDPTVRSSEVFLHSRPAAGTQQTHRLNTHSQNLIQPTVVTLHTIYLCDSTHIL